MMKEQPNFEDERTLHSARRVVPLKKIDAKERHRKRWLLGGAFAAAMLLGVASALLASYMKLRNSPTARTEITEVESPAMPVAVAEEPSGGELPVVENVADTQNAEELVVPVAPKRTPTVRRRAAVSLNNDLIRPRVVRDRDKDDEDELERIREAVLVDSWQERRARRAARRERRNRMNHYDRDLSNLDEIFQGRRNRP